MFSYKGIGEMAITVKDEGAYEGYMVSFTGSDTAGWPENGKAFHGVCSCKRNGVATIQVRGFVTLPYIGTTVPTVGYCELVADGSGNVKVMTGVDGNVSRLVVAVDTTEKTVTFLL